MIRTSYDAEADVFSASFGPADAQSDGSQEVAPGVFVEFDRDGKPIGIEVISVQRRAHRSSSAMAQLADFTESTAVVQTGYLEEENVIEASKRFAKQQAEEAARRMQAIQQETSREKEHDPWAEMERLGEEAMRRDKAERESIRLTPKP